MTKLLIDINSNFVNLFNAKNSSDLLSGIMMLSLEYDDKYISSLFKTKLVQNI
jgi:hypothetical protein